MWSIPLRLARSVKRRGLLRSAVRVYDIGQNAVYDVLHGVDTGYRLGAPRLLPGVSMEQAAHGYHYQPTCQRAVRQALRSLKVRFSDYTFIDFGSGKGK